MYNFKTFHDLTLFEKKIPSKNKNGKCFEVAMETMYKMKNATFMVLGKKSYSKTNISSVHSLETSIY